MILRWILGFLSVELRFRNRISIVRAIVLIANSSSGSLSIFLTRNFSRKIDVSLLFHVSYVFAKFSVRIALKKACFLSFRDFDQIFRICFLFLNASFSTLNSFHSCRMLLVRSESVGGGGQWTGRGVGNQTIARIIDIWFRNRNSTLKNPKIHRKIVRERCQNERWNFKTE